MLLDSPMRILGFKEKNSDVGRTISQCPSLFFMERIK